MKKNFKDNKKRMSPGNIAVIIICAVLASSALLAGVGFISKGFTNTDVGSWFERELNEDNLIKRSDYNKQLPDELDNGLKINWKDDGSIVLRGKVNDTSIDDEQDPAALPFTSVTLQGGKVYTISTDNKNCSEKTFGLLVQYDDVTERVGANEFVIDLSEKEGYTNVVLSIFYENDVTYFGINSYIRPVLIREGSTGGFYK